MRLPSYMKLMVESTNAYNISVVIKRWGIPIIIFNAFRQMEGIKWYHWIMYPKICIGAMINGFK